jgi:hypothetical protein
VAPTDSRGLVCCSSMEDLCNPDTRRRVTVLESGVPTRLGSCKGDLMSPMELRGADGLRSIALRRRELGLWGFLTVLSGRRASLFITSAKALPARFRECLMELLVEGLARGLPPVAELEDLFMCVKLE